MPLVSVSGARCVRGRTTASLIQGRLGLDGSAKQAQTWHVPLAVGVVGRPASTLVVSGATPTRISVAGRGPLLVDQGKRSYARTAYGFPEHAALIAAYARLPLADRLGLLSDGYALAAGGYQPLSRYLSVADRVQAGAHPLE